MNVSLGNKQPDNDKWTRAQWKDKISVKQQENAAMICPAIGRRQHQFCKGGTRESRMGRHPHWECSTGETWLLGVIICSHRYGTYACEC